MKIVKTFGGHKIAVIEKGDPPATEEEKQEFIAETNRLLNGLREEIKRRKKKS